MKMKKIHWLLVLAGTLTVGGLMFYIFPSESRQAEALAHAAREISSAAPWTGRPETDGALEYKAKLAISHSRIDEHHPLASYKPTPGVEGRNALDEIHFKGVPTTAQSVDIARSLLNSGRLSPDEKISMIRILASLHNRDNSTGANNDIALDLKMLATDPNKQVAGEAAISYARLEYLPGTELVLKKGLENGALSTDTYYQEIAHLIPSAPPEKQKEFLAEIRASSNRLATDVLMLALNSGEEFNAASFLRSSEDMAKLLRANEPKFDYGVGQLGGIDAVRYKEWVRASATIESQKTGRNMDDIIVAKLSEPGTDPRKIMSYLSSSEAMPLLASAPPDSQVQRLVSIARLHSNQNPPNSDMRGLVQLIEARMKNPPPAPLEVVFTPPTGAVSPPEFAPHAPQSMPRPHQ